MSLELPAREARVSCLVRVLIYLFVVVGRSVEDGDARADLPAVLDVVQRICVHALVLLGVPVYRSERESQRNCSKFEI